jgi:hypothetical protein
MGGMRPAGRVQRALARRGRGDIARRRVRAAGRGGLVVALRAGSATSLDTSVLDARDGWDSRDMWAVPNVRTMANSAAAPQPSPNVTSAAGNERGFAMCLHRTREYRR